MKLKLLFICISILASGTSHARCIGTVVMGECHGTIVPGSDDSNGGYESNSGTQYQYDLSNPIDQNGYSTDIGAQQRDQMSTDPWREMDLNSGQYGGGIYDR